MQNNYKKGACMQVGLSSACFFMRELNEDALQVIDKLNIPLAEVFFTTFTEYQPSFAQKLLQYKGNVKINSVHALNTQFEPQLFVNHPRAKQDAFYWLRQVLASAKVLDAKYYSFHGIARLKKNSTPKDHGELAPFFEEIMQACAEYNVELCLENVHWALYNEPKIFKQIQAKCPTLKGILDVKQARLAGHSYAEYIQDMGEAIAFAHVSDHTADGKMCLPGKGIFPFEECIQRLLDYGFDGALIIEVYANDYKEYNELYEAYTYLQELVYKCKRN